MVKMCKVLLIDITDNRLNVPDKILYHTQYVRFLTNTDFSGIVFRYFKPLFYLHNGALFCVFFLLSKRHSNTCTTYYIQRSPNVIGF